MADEITPADAPPPSGGGGTNWIKEHKGTAAGIAVVLVVGLLYILKKRSASSSSSSTTGSLGTSTGPAVYEIAPGYAAGSQGAYGQTQDYGSQIAALTQAVNSLGAVSPAAPGSGASTAGSVPGNAATATPPPSAPTPAATPAPAASLVGSGFFTGSGSGYNYISTHNQLTGLEAAGAPVYFEPTPGTYDIAPKNLTGLAPGTPLYTTA